MSNQRPSPRIGAAMLLISAVFCSVSFAQTPAKTAPPAPQNKTGTSNRQTPSITVTPEQQDLQKAIASAQNDRAALVRNLEEFLKKYPESVQRPQVYRALVESTIQLRDFPRATNYAERLVALQPEDPSVNILSIQLLEKYGDTAGWHRATYYCGRVLDIVTRNAMAEKSPRVSNEDWAKELKQSQANVLLARGRLYQKLSNMAEAQKDFETSFNLIPSAAAAQHLAELAELRKDSDEAIRQYGRAFALSDGSNGVASRVEIRKKIGNVWRLAHGSEEGLGDYLLHAIDETSASASPVKSARNEGRKEPYEFTLRRALDGSPQALADSKGKVLVLNFWATWCGPCRDMEPHFERVAAHFAGQRDVFFYALNCDEDETLVPPYLEQEKPKVPVFFADGLDNLLDVNAFPTTVILDRSGKIAFRRDGFDPDTIDKDLTEAVERILNLREAPSASASAKP